MNNFSRIINRLYDLKEYGINKDRLSKEERAYILLTTNLTMFQGVIKEYGDESSFATAYGIPNLIYSINNDLVRIYIPKESFSVDLRQLMKDLDASVVEYYGVVQFDGTEPEARGEYVIDPVIQMSDRVINNFINNNSEDTDKGSIETKEEDSEEKSEEKPKRKLYKLIKKEDKDQTGEDEEIDDTEEEDTNDEESDSSLEDEENSEDEEDLDSVDKPDNEEDEDKGINNSEEELEDNEEDDSDKELEGEEDSFNTNSRAYFMKGIKNPDEEDEEGINDEENSEDEEDPDSVDQFFDDEEVEGNLEKKSNEIEKELSKELDKRIEDEKAKKKKEKEGKRFIKLKKKEKEKKESIEVSSIPSSRLANMDLIKSLASEPIEYSNLGFNDYDRIERIIQKSMMTKDEYKKQLKKRKIFRNIE